MQVLKVTSHLHLLQSIRSILHIEAVLHPIV